MPPRKEFLSDPPIACLHGGSFETRVYASIMSDDDPPDPDVTALLDAWNRGEPGALDRVVEAVHPELHEIAARVFRGERSGHTLQPTAVVNELYLKLRDQRRVSWRHRAQLFGVAARIMRRILVDHARRHAALRRGGGQVMIAFEEIRETPAEVPEVARLDRVLNDLERRSPRQSRIVEKWSTASRSTPTATGIG